MLLPTLAKAKATSLRIKCTSNCKNIAHAFHMYALDYKDRMVWPNWGVNNVGWLYDPQGSGPPAPKFPSEAPFTGGLLWSYIHNSKVYRCPAEYTNQIPTFSMRKNQLSTYVMNGASMGFKPTPVKVVPPMQGTHRLSDFKPATAYCMWEPDPLKQANYNDASSSPTSGEGPSTAHGTGCVVTAFDGHVELLQYATFLKQSVKTNTQTFYWCDPDSADGAGYAGSFKCSLW